MLKGKEAAGRSSTGHKQFVVWIISLCIIKSWLALPTTDNWQSILEQLLKFSQKKIITMPWVMPASWIIYGLSSDRSRPSNWVGWVFYVRVESLIISTKLSIDFKGYSIFCISHLLAEIRESEPILVCLHIYLLNIYYEESTHIIMEAERSHDLWPKRWRPRKASSIVQS